MAETEGWVASTTRTSAIARAVTDHLPDPPDQRRPSSNGTWPTATSRSCSPTCGPHPSSRHPPPGQPAIPPRCSQSRRAEHGPAPGRGLRTRSSRGAASRRRRPVDHQRPRRGRHRDSTTLDHSRRRDRNRRGRGLRPPDSTWRWSAADLVRDRSCRSGPRPTGRPGLVLGLPRRGSVRALALRGRRHAHRDRLRHLRRRTRSSRSAGAGRRPRARRLRQRRDRRRGTGRRCRCRRRTGPPGGRLRTRPRATWPESSTASSRRRSTPATASHDPRRTAGSLGPRPHEVLRETPVSRGWLLQVVIVRSLGLDEDALSGALLGGLDHALELCSGMTARPSGPPGSLKTLSPSLT